MDDIHPLRAFRERQTPPLSQAALADLLNTTKASVSRWETGKRKPEVELVPSISEKTGIPPGKLRPDLAHLFGATARRGSRQRSRARPRAA